MASSLLRLRRAVSLSSALIRPLSTSTVTPHRNPNPNPSSAAQSRHFRSSLVSLSSARDSFRKNNYNGNLDDEIGPDTILFEGCDYNHWLITMDFPKDPAPTREEMIETYLQTLAKVVGSYEEAKKKMYAFSTTTYNGFQCLVSEEESEKFKNLPGVVFVLPDSYLDPVNKEYGGDKYENGIITPRPLPPMQYGRQGGRYGDRNRDFNRNPRQMPSEQGSRGYDNQRPRYEDNRNFNQQQNPSMPNQQDNQGYDNQRPRFGDNRNFGPQPNTQVPNHQFSPYANQGQNSQVQPNYGPTAGGERRDPLHNNYHQVQNQQPSSNYANQGPAYGVNRQERHPPVQPNYGSTVGGERTGSLPTNASPWGRDAMPNYQNQQGFHNPQGERIPEQRGYAGETRNYVTPQGGVAQGQRAEGNYGQMGGGSGHGSGGNSGQTQGGSFGNGVHVRNHPPSFNYQNDYTATEEAEILKDTQSQQRNYGQMGQTENQGRY